ncbi:MAG: LuxR C-terminal-related transcriptional regulator [Vulcanimicrobiota bacterium]
MTVLLLVERGLFAEGVGCLLSHGSDWQIQMVFELEPALDLLDHSQVVLYGLALEHLSSLCQASRTPVLVVADDPGEQAVKAAFGVGASGFISKNVAGEQLLAAIEAVAAGGIYVGPKAAPSILANLRRFEGASPVPVSPREQQLLDLLCGESLTNRQLAARLGLSASTIKTQLKSLFNKYGVGDRTSLVLKATGRKR